MAIKIGSRVMNELLVRSWMREFNRDRKTVRDCEHSSLTRKELKNVSAILLQMVFIVVFCKT